MDITCSTTAMQRQGTKADTDMTNLNRYLYVAAIGMFNSDI